MMKNMKTIPSQSELLSEQSVSFFSNKFCYVTKETRRFTCFIKILVGSGFHAVTQAIKLQTGTHGNVVVTSIYQLGHCTAEHAHG